MNITQFTMEDVRCFSERQTLEIRPLTFLVGENSTGKTTALACFHVLANYLQGEGVDFNVDPYSMGIFTDIVRNSRPKQHAFKLGFTFKNGNEDAEWTVAFVKKKQGFEPAVGSSTLKFTDGEILLKAEDNPITKSRLATFDEKRNQYQITYEADSLGYFFRGIFLQPFKDRFMDTLDGQPEEKSALGNYLEVHRNSIRRIYGPVADHFQIAAFSTSPVRSRPQRTYDPTREFDDPEGSDVPMYLMQIKATHKENWEVLKKQLVEFGKNSGLFQNIEVKNFERSLGAPFQLKFTIRGPNANIVDVGYGVSQILPILVHILKSNPHGMNFSLLQQPEIHLHPKAQAELSSLLVKLANKGNQSFIVETHSDYMIDRARVDIMRGNIRPEDVSLIYFQPKGRVVKVHNIRFDKMANLIGAPTNYREFFLKESKRLMGFKD